MTFSPLNLVPNPSFEDTNSCPTGISQIYRTDYWYSPTANSPDFFHSCVDVTTISPPDIPQNLWGTQSAHSGSAYTGVVGLYSAANGRDYVSIKLEDTLIASRRYCVEFFVSLADSSFSGINFIGTHLSSTPDTIYCLPCPINFLWNLPFQPQVEEVTVTSDMSAWIKISGSFVALGTECYLTIGVFKPDSLLIVDTIRGDGSNLRSYYYIDDVAVWECDTPAIVYPDITFFPNPSNGNFNITGNFPAGSQFVAYNMLGQVVCDPVLLPEGNNNVPVFIDVAVGLYYYKIISNSVVLSKGKILIVE